METIEITEVKRDERTPALLAALVSVWDASVRASHDFLTADDIIEMLFLAPAQFGQGLGRRIVTMALDTYGVTHVDVNEQNARAAAFYRRMGFRPFRRDALDDQGTPFPILRMERRA